MAFPGHTLGAADSLHTQCPCTDCVPRDVLAPSLLTGLLLLWQRLSGECAAVLPPVCLVLSAAVQGLGTITAAREWLLQSREETAQAGRGLPRVCS